MVFWSWYLVLVFGPGICITGSDAFACSNAFPQYHKELHSSKHQQLLSKRSLPAICAVSMPHLMCQCMFCSSDHVCSVCGNMSAMRLSALF